MSELILWVSDLAEKDGRTLLQTNRPPKGDRSEGFIYKYRCFVIENVGFGRKLKIEDFKKNEKIMQIEEIR